MADNIIPDLRRVAHAVHCKHSLLGLPSSGTSLESSRLAVGFYCLGSLDLLGSIQDKISETDREGWREWIWEQQIKKTYGTGFRPGTFMASRPPADVMDDDEYDVPHIIMTYVALLSLAILRDEFSNLDRSGILRLLRRCQKEDGSFSTTPTDTDSDLRVVYCAFAISSMLNDWSGMDVKRAVDFISKCRTYEGGYGQSPYNEAQGGTTYTAIASLYMIPEEILSSQDIATLTESERRRTIRWLIQQQQADCGGFSGRTGKVADACYCFWCSASLKILGVGDVVNTPAMVKFLGECQFKYGGIAKAPGDHPDPYHTYLSLAAIAVFSPTTEYHSSWTFDQLDPLLNAHQATAQWVREHIGKAA